VTAEFSPVVAPLSDLLPDLLAISPQVVYGLTVILQATHPQQGVKKHPEEAGRSKRFRSKARKS
jgi:hypothetical protein